MEGNKGEGKGRDGMRWDGMGWDGMGWDEMGKNGKRGDDHGMEWSIPNATEWNGMGWDGIEGGRKAGMNEEPAGRWQMQELTKKQEIEQAMKQSKLYPPALNSLSSFFHPSLFPLPVSRSHQLPS